MRDNKLAVFDHIEMRPGGREELIQTISDDFGYQGILSEHDRYCDRTVPWHWHQELEFFYIRRGPVVYATPHEHVVLHEGAAGFVNANVLHMTQAENGAAGTSLLVHEVRPRLLAEPGSYIWRSYVEPVLEVTSIGLVLAQPEEGSRAARLSRQMKQSFDTFEKGGLGWEMRLRDELSELWLGFFELLGPRLAGGPMHFDDARDERLKRMIDYVGLHYPEELSVAQIAEAAYSSERECHRTFKEALGTSPAQYLREFRIQQACRMLAHTTRSIGTVAQMSGLGSASHFGQVFRKALGQTPSEYRQSWQKSDNLRQIQE